MEERGIYNYTVSQRDVDFTGKCSPASLMNHILQAAGDDADLNGFGIKDLNMGNCSWVLSRMCTEFNRRPSQGERISVRTWVSEVGRLMTTRNMVVFDGNREQVACAVTQWAVIDIDSRRALDIRANVDYRGKILDEPSPAGPPERIHKLDSEECAVKTVVYSDVDFNRHMNAMKYVEWILDHAPVVRVTESLRRIDINFLKEALLGSRLSLICMEADGVVRYEIREQTAGDPLCRCGLTFS
ncbi:MAG: thioesterase [Alistipes sp.]|nr:thioesterase [Alistipes sp.]